LLQFFIILDYDELTWMANFMQATAGDISVKIIHLAGVAYGFSQVR
jgi:hypothetical protein